MRRVSQNPDLSEFRSLVKGWDSYDGSPITDKAIRTAELTFFVPTSDGGVQIELHADGWEIEIEIGPDGKIAEVYTKHPTRTSEVE